MEQAPLNREGTPSIQEALSQAEQEHWLERPNAPLAIRLASFVLDLIFIYLFIHGQHRLLQALSIYSATSTQSTLFLLNPFSSDSWISLSELASFSFTWFFQ